MAKTATTTKQTIGKNIGVQIEGTILTLTIDLSKEQGASSSGKNMLIASTGGNVEVGNTGVKLGLNAYRAKGK